MLSGGDMNIVAHAAAKISAITSAGTSFMSDDAPPVLVVASGGN